VDQFLFIAHIPSQSVLCFTFPLPLTFINLNIFYTNIFCMYNDVTISCNTLKTLKDNLRTSILKSSLG